ncbi:hypothetical protein PGT21_009868 [Puccinia graminis f. sp. tritici]|uniref:Uncharacterized protein n=1 Tax=Puccinia graminis f. sp. tritici TaxID=56615 RepID=A0A5B0PS40_PUCGR|nr:hypothetical protein PGT21_009868 [Puccinia graminis f. sp. tritici]KAA1128255.1 hypothetical protein PGTUg99_017503 [Puccinia graminis f. sp. tritici]
MIAVGHAPGRLISSGHPPFSVTGIFLADSENADLLLVNCAVGPAASSSGPRQRQTVRQSPRSSIPSYQSVQLSLALEKEKALSCLIIKLISLSPVVSSSSRTSQ